MQERERRTLGGHEVGAAGGADIPPDPVLVSSQDTDLGMMAANAGDHPPPGRQEGFQGVGQAAQGRLRPPQAQCGVEIVLAKMAERRPEPEGQEECFPWIPHQLAQLLHAQAALLVHAQQQRSANGFLTLPDLADDRRRHTEGVGQRHIVLQLHLVEQRIQQIGGSVMDVAGQGIQVPVRPDEHGRALGVCWNGGRAQERQWYVVFCRQRLRCGAECPPTVLALIAALRPMQHGEMGAAALGAADICRDRQLLPERCLEVELVAASRAAETGIVGIGATSIGQLRAVAAQAADALLRWREAEPIRRAREERGWIEFVEQRAEAPYITCKQSRVATAGDSKSIEWCPRPP